MTQPSSNKHHEFPILYTRKPALSSLHPYALGPEISTVSRAYKRGSQDTFGTALDRYARPLVEGSEKTEEGRAHRLHAKVTHDLRDTKKPNPLAATRGRVS